MPNGVKERGRRGNEREKEGEKDREGGGRQRERKKKEEKAGIVRLAKGRDRGFSKWKVAGSDKQFTCQLIRLRLI